MTEHEPPATPDDRRPSIPADSKAEPTRSAPAPAPSILDRVATRIGQSARVHLPDEGSSGAASPLVAVSGVSGASAAKSRALPTGRGNYQVLGEIARGGMGVIYKSHDTDLGRDVAMKVLLEQHADSDTTLQRFVEEAQIGGQLQHPGIVPVYEMGLMADDRPYFTMKLVKGRTLAKLMSARKDAADDRRRFLGIFEKVCETVAYAHARNVIHRDLKPANIMVGAFGEVQVVDWGLAKVLQEGGVADQRPAAAAQAQVSIIETVRSGSTASGTESLAGSVLGTPSYMPPEQAQGRIDQVNERADVFGLGAILCEILTGKPPYTGAHGNVLVEATKALQDDARERLAACGADAELVELVTDCIAPAQAARPADAAVVLERVQACLATQERRTREAELAAAQADLRATQERKARRLTLALATTVLAAVVAGGLGYLSVTRADAERRAQTARQVDALLEEAGIARERGDFEAALAACASADLALAAGADADADADAGAGAGADTGADTGDGDAELSARIARATERAEAGVEGVRLEQERAARVAAFVSDLDGVVFGFGSEWTSRFANEWRSRRFATAFEDFGLDPLGSDAEAVLATIVGTGQTTPIVFALDEWSRLSRNTKSWRHPDALRLSELAARLDDDPVRTRIRVAIDQDDNNALGRIVSDAAGADWPPTTVAMLYFAMNDMGLRSRAEAVLRDCQRRYPTDSGINQLLARLLLEQAVPDFEEILRYLSAAQAARSDNSVVTDFLCEILRRMGRVDEALETLLAGVRGNPEGMWLAGGETLLQTLAPYTSDTERRDVRRLVHETLLAAAPLTPERRGLAAWFLVGTSDPTARDPALALELIEAALGETDAAEPEDVADWWGTLGLAQYQLGRDRDAISSTESALRLASAGELDPEPDRMIVIALALERLGQKDEARPWYERALALREPASERNPFWGEVDYLWTEAARRFGEGGR